MTVEDLLFFAKQHIHSDHAKILIAELLNCNPLELLNYLEKRIPEEKVELLKREIKALEENTPLQYVLGNVNFYGNKFYVDERVLIPRFETEELVENTIKYINRFFTEPVDIIDLGCGSGVIGLTLEKKVSTKTVDLVDISSSALEVARKNCGNLNSNANIIQSDMFSAVNKKYDVIISNPPYIKTSEEIEDMGYFYEEPEVGENHLDRNGCRGRTNDPRGWESISRTLYAFEEDLKNGKFVGKDVEALLKASIGSKLREEWAEEFFDFYNHPTLTVEEIVEKRYTQADLPTDINEKFATMAGLLNATPEQVGVCREFIRKHCDPEYLSVYDIYWAGNDEKRMEKIAELREISAMQLEDEGGMIR